MKSRKLITFVLVIIGLCSFFSSLSAAEQSIMQKYQTGMNYQNEENFYLAQQYYLEVVKQNPAFSDAWYKLAECSYKLGEFELALQYLSSAEKYEKNNIKIQNLKGMVFVSQGKLEDAKKIFNDILKKYPNDVDSHFGLAEIELFEGRFSGAEFQYNEALKRQATNKKALLAMALICAEKQKFSDSDKYLKRALGYYSNDPEVHFLAAVIYSMKGDYSTSEKHARIAVEINGNFERSYELLTTILYKLGRYNEVIDLSDFLISRNRKNSTAWYLKGVAQQKLGNTNAAIQTWTSGLNVQPQDEIMRFMMELDIRENYPVEDARRKNFANAHLENARQYKSRYDGQGAVYEYQRALFLDPTNYEARNAYAKILEINKMYELYLKQLLFIKEHNSSALGARAKTELNDKIEAYESLLKNTLSKKWQIDSFYLDKLRWKIAVFYEDTTSSFIHADINKITARACADIFSGVAITSVKTQVSPISGFGEAFKNARSNGFDYFVIVSLSEGQNDMTLNSTMYSARTGLEVSKNQFYCTGNNRFSTVLRRFRNSVLEKLAVKGKILKRNGKTILIDLGKSENIVKNSKFVIVKKGGVRTADKGAGITYSDDDVIGTVIVTNVGEDVSEAEIQEHGFYDRINIEDEVVLHEMPATVTADTRDGNAVDTVPAANAEGEAVIKSEVKNSDFIKEIKKAVERPSILNLLRNIY
ncbi:MAG: tetratricopeptide repeat protein [Treponema sp.]|nr:tetratricopeptide repeat protein [Treponema sp.]